jgi:hypothetical protein
MLLNYLRRAVLSSSFRPLVGLTANHRNLVIACEAVLSAAHAAIMLAATFDLLGRLIETREQDSYGE